MCDFWVQRDRFRYGHRQKEDTDKNLDLVKNIDTDIAMSKDSRHSFILTNIQTQMKT